MKLIPCWSAVMVSIFTYGNITETSASSESLFNDLKTRVFQHKTLPLRVDEFIEIHIDNILGSMKILGANQNNANKIKSENDNKLINSTYQRTPDKEKSNSVSPTAENVNLLNIPEITL